MDACSSCGAPLAPDLDWCGRCYAPAAARTEATTDEAPLWIQTQRREHVSFEGASYSRFRAGPTSFGAVGRTVMTLLVIVGAVAGYPLSRGLILASIGFDVPGRRFMIGYAVVAAVAAAYLLSRIWRRARTA